VRCLVCGCSRLDPMGLNCALCGHALGERDEQCYVTEETKATLRAHSDALRAFGITLEEQDLIQKSVGAIEAIGLALAIADSLDKGVLRKLVVYLHKLAIPKEEILRLRLDEPEAIADILDEVEKDKQA